MVLCISYKSSLEQLLLAISTVNRYTSLLSVSFKFAIAKGFARTNPVVGIPRAREEEHPVPFVSSGDVERLVGQYLLPPASP